MQDNLQMWVHFLEEQTCHSIISQIHVHENLNFPDNKSFFITFSMESRFPR